MVRVLGARHVVPLGVGEREGVRLGRWGEGGSGISTLNPVGVSVPVEGGIAGWGYAVHLSGNRDGGGDGGDGVGGGAGSCREHEPEHADAQRAEESRKPSGNWGRHLADVMGAPFRSWDAGSVEEQVSASRLAVYRRRRPPLGPDRVPDLCGQSLGERLGEPRKMGNKGGKHG